jgi:hypothetical protein
MKPSFRLGWEAEYVDLCGARFDSDDDLTSDSLFIRSSAAAIAPYYLQAGDDDKADVSERRSAGVTTTSSTFERTIQASSGCCEFG